MIFGYKTISDNESGEFITVIVAASNEKEYREFFVTLGSKNSDILKETVSDFQMMEAIDMMMDDNFSHLSKPVAILSHTDEGHQTKFFEEFPVKEIVKEQAISRQQDMEKETAKIEAHEDEKEKRLMADLTGEIYVEPSIEEIYGLTIHDPWDKRTKEEKERDSKYDVNHNNTNMTSGTELTDDSAFGGANAQRAYRRAIRKEQDPTYEDTKFIGFEEVKDDEPFINKLLYQKPSDKTLENQGRGLTPEELMDLESSKEETPKSQSSINQEPVYVDEKTNLQTLENMRDDFNDQREDRQAGNFRSVTPEDAEFVKVKVESLPETIRNKIKSFCESKEVHEPTSIPEYWYPDNSKVDDWCVLSRNDYNLDFDIIGYHNVDTTNMKSVNMFGPEVILIKQSNNLVDSLVLYARTTTDTSTVVDFYLVRIKA